MAAQVRFGARSGRAPLIFGATMLAIGLLFADAVSLLFALVPAAVLGSILFLAGLQSISTSLYEAADIDGCTAWERFWKITFPILSPVILVNLIYTITDTFTTYTNSTMVLILENGRKMEFAYSSALAWIYFLIIVVILGITYLFINRRVAYLDT
mgnify:CR=1 FL=1